MRARTAATVLLAATLAACAMSALEKRLDPASRDFLSKVRYIINPEERKTFLNLPAVGEREKFIVEFWKRRDPTPATEANEFKTEYFSRIETANRLFSGGGAPGWLQDRGRIWILLGQPSNREAYPRGMSFYDIPTEIWYYGFFPIVFRDPDWSGDYRLDPLSANQLGEIMSAQMDMKPRTGAPEGKLKGEAEVAPRPGGVTIRLKIPFDTIGFTEDDAGRMTTSLKVQLVLKAEPGAKVWDSEKEFPLAYTWQEVDANQKTAFTQEWSVDLAQGKYVLMAKVENKADQSQVFRTVPFRTDREPRKYFRPPVE